jgi:predicted phosphodiesterase
MVLSTSELFDKWMEFNEKRIDLEVDVSHQEPLDQITPICKKIYIHKRIETVKTLVIPDCHVKPGDNFDRFEALANYIITKKPANIVQLGDFLTFSSLSHWDRNNKLKMEGIRYKQDINAGNTAIDLMFAPISKSRSYNPNIVWCFGNHDEAWPERYLEQNPALAGHIDVIADLRLKERGIVNIVPYKKYANICGTMFTHVPINGAGIPVSGKYAVQKTSDLVSKSLVFGHTHSLGEYSCQRHGDDKIIQIYTAGCFFEELDDYAADTTMTHNIGISMLTHWGDGRYDISQVSLERLRSEYL